MWNIQTNYIQKIFLILILPFYFQVEEMNSLKFGMKL